MATATNLVPHKIFLAGRWVESPDTLVVENPARPGEPAGLTYQATPEQYEEAVQAAHALDVLGQHRHQVSALVAELELCSELFEEIV